MLLFFCFIQTCVIAQTDTAVFKISPKIIYPGDVISMQYNAANSILAGKKNIQCVMYQYHSNFTWTAHDITLNKKGAIWQSSIKLAPNSALVVFLFTNDTITDKGKVIPYVWMVKEKNTELMMQGSYYAWGIMRNALLLHTIPFMLDSASFKENEVTRMWIRNEIKNHHESRPYVFKTSFQLYKQNNDIAKIADAVRNEITDILKDTALPEKVWADARDVFADVLNDQKTADSLEKVILTRFPLGVAARDKQIKYLYTKEKDQVKQGVEFEALLKKFPPDSFINVHTTITDLYYGKLFRNIIYNPIIKDSNYSLLYKYLPVAPFSELSTFYHHMVEVTHDNKQISAEACLHLSEIIFNEMMKRPSPPDISPLQWKKQITSNNRFCFYMHALILTEHGKTTEAMPVAEQVKNIYQNRNANFNELYVKLLLANRRSTEVNAYVLKSVAENAATPYLINLLRKQYFKSPKATEAGFADYFNSLKSEDKLATQKNEIREALINQPITPFNLESNKGGFRNLAQLKGKTIVLDFWATWCSPCKAAMPGMALVLEKYRKDTNVVFFFVSTMETAKDFKSKIAAFLQEKKYPFEVLYDAYNDSTAHYDQMYQAYSKAFHFTGIPQKMIIDAEGNLRWRNTGYAGSPSALADEISTVIETIKKEQKNGAGLQAWQGHIGVERILLEHYADSFFISIPEMNINRNKGFAVSNTKDSLVFNAGYLGMFRARYAPDQQTLEASITPQMQKTATSFVMQRVKGLQPLILPQTPQPPFTYSSRNVHFTNADSSIQFGATLTIPEKGFSKAVVMVSGTGKQDRDGTMAGHKMFLVLADQLSRKGIAVLRVDDRGTGETTGKYEDATTADFAADANAAVHYLQSLPEFTGKQIGLAGHSEGGAAAAIAAADNKSIAFVISLSGLASKGLDALLYQNTNLVSKADISALNKERYNKANALMFATAQQYAATPGLESKLRETYNAWFTKDQQMLDSMHITNDHFFFPLESYLKQATTKWYRYHIQFDPEIYFSKIHVPVLAVYGDKDIMVDGKQSIINWKEGLTKAHNDQFTSFLIPGLNHILQHCVKCTVAESFELEETLAPEVIKNIEQWINALH